MKKDFRKINLLILPIFSLLIGVGFILLSPATAQAQDLSVLFQNGNGTPLFEEANFLPGESVTRWVQVINNTSVTKSIATKISLFNDLDNLGDVLHLDIISGGVVYYNDTLSQFYQDGVISLGSLNGGDSKQYDFTITFLSNTGNEYNTSDETKIIFDFQIGQDITPPTTTTTSGGGSSTTTTIPPTTTTITVLPTTTTTREEVLGESTKREFFEEGGEEGTTTTTTAPLSKFVAGISTIGPFSCPVNLTMSGINPLLASLLCLGQNACDTCLNPLIILLLGIVITLGSTILVKKYYG